MSYLIRKNIVAIANDDVYDDIEDYYYSYKDNITSSDILEYYIPL